MTNLSNNAKKRFVAFVLGIAEHNSQDAERSMEYLKEQGIDIDVPDAVNFMKWLKSLHELYKEATGDPEWRLNTREARKFYDSGMTAYQTFRETFDMENDSE